MDEVFGRYRLRGLLGAGGMGQVFRAFDTELHRDVAIKVLPAQVSVDAGFVQRFRREARAAAGLGEPHVVPIHDSGEIEGRLFIAMQLIAGVDLGTLLRAEGPLPAGRAVDVVEQAAAALDAAHEAGLVHRDVKPANLLVTPKDFVYLIDFGIARAAGETALTGTGGAIGTLAYMAPERFTRGQVDKRADIYALACVLFQCLTGRTPYPAVNAEQQMFAHVAGPPPRPSQVGVGPEFDSVIARGMAMDPDQRYQSAGELAGAARAALHGDPHAAPDDAGRTYAVPAHATVPAPTMLAPAPRPRRRRIAALAAVTVLAVAVATGIIYQTAHRDHGSPTSATPARTAAGPTRTTASPSPTVVNPFQSVLPFTGLDEPDGVAVDGAGNVYVTSHHQVLKLAPGSASPEVLFSASYDILFGLAVDGAGTVYVANWDKNQVVKLAAGSATPKVLPFNGLTQPVDVAVDRAGMLYVPDHRNNQVFKLAAGSSTPQVLHSNALSAPSGVAVDSTGNLYVTDQGNDHVLKLAPGSATFEVLPFTDLRSPWGVAVDGAGSLYVADEGNNRVLKLAAGSLTPEVLALTGLKHPHGLAVDGAGNLYVADSLNKRVVKLAVH